MKLAIIATLALVSHYGHATELVKEVIMNGAGCPQETSSYLVNDKSEVEIFSSDFDAYSATSPGNRARKACAVGVTLNVPSGMQVSLGTVTYDGFVAVPIGGKANFRTEAFFAGQRGKVVEREWSSASENIVESFDISSPVGNSWSDCGEDVIARVNASIRTKSSKTRGTYIGVGEGGDKILTLNLIWQKCDGN
ncbi:MAG: hypothetical protein CMP10_18545 [Zetaproteobacteria bacterium]|nr:hypothetical protein [Pseudobdellovibrionaceae bacterium]